MMRNLLQAHSRQLGGIVLATVLAAGWNLPALAEGSEPTTQKVEPATGPAKRVEIPTPFERIRQVLADLKLSSEQKTTIESVLKNAAEEFRGMVPGLQTASVEDRADTMRDFVKGVNAKVTAVLNDDQKAAFEQKIDTFRQNIGGRVGPMIERLQTAVEQLNLEDAQKTQAREVVKTAIEKMKQARQDANGDTQLVREKSQAVIAESRQKLKEILSPEQQQKLMELMRPKGDPNRAGAAGPGVGQRRRTDGEAKPPAEMNEASPATKPVESAPAMKAESAQPAGTTGALDPGKPAPVFTLNRVDGQTVPFSSFKGKVTILVFGNYSAPTFRKHAADIDAMRKELGLRANVYIVYTRESYPVGGWEVQRNKDDGIQVEQPKDQASRVRAAKLAHDELKITTPILVDTMDDATATAYDGFTNASVVIGRDGNIAARQKWFDPYMLRRSVDEAMNAKPSTHPSL